MQAFPSPSYSLSLLCYPRPFLPSEFPSSPGVPSSPFLPGAQGSLHPDQDHVPLDVTKPWRTHANDKVPT